MNTCAPGDERALWFFTHKDSQKITEIQRNAQVGLGYADPDNATYVTVAGSASVVDDKAKIKELWRKDFRGFFPKGTEDSRITLIEVEIENGEFWNSPSNLLVRASAYAEAVTTGQRHQPTPDE
ncbi:MAG: pyridoxamine 5'-phosphate oxidase family protein [Bacteroidota bacterium]|nr:pyridoxamine 5'-phosphate oxidase family protein [Bacteroidota bacterium]